MKVKWKPRHNHNDNDCWCDALAFATGKPYEEVYELLKGLRSKDGALKSAFIAGVLFNEGFTQFANDDNTKYCFPYNDFTIANLLWQVNHRDCHVVVIAGEHTTYLHDGTIYDNIAKEKRSEFLNKVVDYYYIKLIGKIEP